MHNSPSSSPSPHSHLPSPRHRVASYGTSLLGRIVSHPLDLRRVVLGVLACAAPTLAALGAGPVRSEEPAADNFQPLDGHTRAFEYRETMDDPPGTPAQPDPAARPAETMRLGRFTTTQVNVDSKGANIPGDAANEPSIAVDPTNPLRMVIGWRQFDTISSNFRQAGNAYSVDGGRTWTNRPPLTAGIFRSDPVLAFDRDGTFFYNSLEGDLTTDLFTSTDGGASWAGPFFAFGGDKQWMAVDRTGGAADGYLYQTWSGLGDPNIFNRSTDGGNAFSTPSGVPQAPKWGTIEVADDGTVYLAGSGSPLSNVFVAWSSDAQNPAVATPSFNLTAVNLGGSQAVGTGPNPAGLLGQIWFAIDRSSGPTSGNLYLCASMDPPGPDPMNVMFTRSTDGGLTWSAPVRINDDAGEHWQWFATMSVAPNGRIDVAWNDNRDTPLLERLSRLYVSSSTDGGLTWSPNEAASPSWDSFLGFPNQDKIGDYYHMVSDLVGADLAWAATFNGEQDVYHTRIGDYDCNANGVGDSLDVVLGNATDLDGNGILDVCEADPSGVPGTGPDDGPPEAPEEIGNAALLRLDIYPNPFKHTAQLVFHLPAAGPLHIEILDVQGRVLRTLAEDLVAAGRHTVQWDGTDNQGRELPPGVYMVHARFDNREESRRVIVVR